MAQPDEAAVLAVALQHLHNTQQQLQKPVVALTSGVGSVGSHGPLVEAASRALHPVSRRLCGTARGTRTRVNLLAYYGLRKNEKSKLGPLHPCPPPVIPWSLLAAAQGVKSMSLRLEQVPALLAGPPQALAALTGRLETLEVDRRFGLQKDVSSNTATLVSISWAKMWDIIYKRSSSSSSSYQEDHPVALGRLLPQCSGLHALRVVTGVLQCCREGFFFHMDGCQVDWAWLDSLGGLQQLQLVLETEFRGHAGPPPPSLTALSSMTQLSLKGFTSPVELGHTLAPLTQLQRLQLSTVYDGPGLVGATWVTALQQLTHLELTSSCIEQLPGNMGRLLPHLQALLVSSCGLKALPRGLSRLTCLAASDNEKLGGGDGLAGLCDATALRRLDLSECGLTSTSCLTGLRQLEVLQLCGTQRLCSCRTDDVYCGHCAVEGGPEEEEQQQQQAGQQQPPPSLALPKAVNLRHLDLRLGEWWVEDLVAAGPLQHLTLLEVSKGLGYRQGHSEAGSLPSLGALPALRQLNIRKVAVEDGQWASLGAWLGLHTQLTRLSLRGCLPPNAQPSGAAHRQQQQAQGLAQLPTQLVELDLTGCGLQQLPPRLGQLTKLKVLLLGGNEGLPAELPPWLPALQQLEVLEVGAVEDVEAAVVLLQQLSALRQFSVSQGADSEGPSSEDPSGEELGPAQQLYGQLPHLQPKSGYHFDSGLTWGVTQVGDG